MFCLSDPTALSQMGVVAAIVSAFPLVAFLYTAIVWFAYAFYREFHWNHWPLLKALGIRWVFVVVSWLISIGIVAVCESCQNDATAASIPEPPSKCLAGTTAMVAVLCLGASIHLMLQTRREDVVGVDRAPFYGSHALQGKFIVVTGANAGIGKETARQLAAQGATVALLCRNPLRAKRAMQDIRELQSVLHNENPTKYPTPRITKDQLVFVPLDLTSFDSVRQAAKAIRQHLELRTNQSGRQVYVDSLVCNAGLMMGNQSTTKDGLETMMQANHLGHFLLIQLMLEGGMLKTTGEEPSRVCLLTSSTYEFAASTNGFDFEDPYCSTGQRAYTLFGQYSITKLANLLTAKELAKRYNNGSESLAVFAVHPGIVRTNVTSNMNWYWRLGNHAVGWIVASISKTAAEGAYSTVHVTAAPLKELDYWKKGSYIANCKEETPHEYVHGASGDTNATRLWEWSEAELARTNTGDAAEAGEKKEQ